MSVISTETHTYDLLELDEIIESYDFDTDPVLAEHFHAVEQALCRDIESYGAGVNDYGKTVMAHLIRTSIDGRDFMVSALGFSAKAANNFYHANLLQDLGKIHPAFDPALWTLPHRPTPEEKKEKRTHVFRGPQILGKALNSQIDILFDHPHINTVIPAIQLFHHERVDGTGTYGKTGAEMGKVIKTACIVDALDGDMIARPHQGKAGRTLTEALERMKTGEKYQGAFDGLLDVYISFKLQGAGYQK
jgi:hypothetical protein